MVAIVLLLIGVLGTVKMIDDANGLTLNTRGREGATNLARQLVEDGPRRALRQPERHRHLVGELQVDVPDNDPASGWQVRRRGFLYTVTATVCTLDDDQDDPRVTGSAAPSGSSLAPRRPRRLPRTHPLTRTETPTTSAA